MRLIKETNLWQNVTLRNSTSAGSHWTGYALGTPLTKPRMYQVSHTMKTIKFCCSLVPVLMMAMACTTTGPFDINPQLITKKGCEVKKFWGNPDVNNCESWIDVTTPNDRVGMCKSFSYMYFRVNKYTIERSRNEARATQKPRGGPGRYNEIKERRKCGDNGRTFRRGEGPVNGEYFIARFLGLYRGSFVTIGDNVCGKSPNIFVYLPERSELMSVFRRFREYDGKIKDIYEYKDDLFYLVNGVHVDISSRTLYRDNSGNIVTPMQQNYIQLANLIHTQCGKFPESIRITGKYPVPVKSASVQKQVTYKPVYEGTVLINSSGKNGAPRPNDYLSTRVVHDNKLRAENIKANAKLARTLQDQALFESERARLKREERAAKGALYLHVMMSVLRKNSPCFDDSLSAADKSIAGCGP